MQQIVVAVVLFLRGKKLSLVSDLSVRETTQKFYYNSSIKY
jgi:hypothetical protein